jgi:hypothetical protein
LIKDDILTMEAVTRGIAAPNERENGAFVGRAGLTAFGEGLAKGSLGAGRGRVDWAEKHARGGAIFRLSLRWRKRPSRLLKNSMAADGWA